MSQIYIEFMKDDIIIIMAAILNIDYFCIFKFSVISMIKNLFIDFIL